MKNNVKRMAAAALAAVMCAALTGCSNNNRKKITDQDIDDAINALDNYGKSSSSSTKKQPSNPELEQIDPFKDLKVTFSGTAPQSTVQLAGKNSYVTYTADKMTGVRNGDVVTVTAEVISYYSDKYELTETEKEYTVSGLSAYAMKLAEIPEETMTKLLNQASNKIAADAAGWWSGNKLLNSNFIGCYYLALKDGFSTYGSHNEIYCVYKINALIDGKYTNDNAEHEETYYTYVKFSEIMLLGDGVCSVDLSKGALTNHMVNGVYSKNGNYGFYGYADLDSMFNAVVTKQIDKFDYENTVKD